MSVKRAKHVAISEAQSSRPITKSDACAVITFDSIFNLLTNALDDAASSDGPLAPCAEDLRAALHDFETRHPKRAAVALNIFNPRVAVAQNAVGPPPPQLTRTQAFIGVFNELACVFDFLNAVPETHQLRVLKHIVYCTHRARGAEVEFDCVLTTREGALADVRLVMLCERMSGTLVVGVRA